MRLRTHPQPEHPAQLALSCETWRHIAAGEVLEVMRRLPAARPPPPPTVGSSSADEATAFVLCTVHTRTTFGSVPLASGRTSAVCIARVSCSRVPAHRQMAAGLRSWHSGATVDYAGQAPWWAGVWYCKRRRRHGRACVCTAHARAASCRPTRLPARSARPVQNPFRVSCLCGAHS